VADLICAEAAQASYNGKRPREDHSRSSTRSDGSRSTTTSSSNVEFLTRMHPPIEPSSMTPMERFATLSPANDPCPWESRRMMTRVGLEEGSMEMLGLRVDAAVIVDATRKNAMFSSLSLAQSS
jgi:hypothetical protein